MTDFEAIKANARRVLLDRLGEDIYPSGSTDAVRMIWAPFSGNADSALIGAKTRPTFAAARSAPAFIGDPADIDAAGIVAGTVLARPSADPIDQATYYTVKEPYPRDDGLVYLLCREGRR